MSSGATEPARHATAPCAPVPALPALGPCKAGRARCAAPRREPPHASPARPRTAGRRQGPGRHPHPHPHPHVGCQEALEAPDAVAARLDGGVADIEGLAATGLEAGDVGSCSGNRRGNQPVAAGPGWAARGGAGAGARAPAAAPRLQQPLEPGGWRPTGALARRHFAGLDGAAVGPLEAPAAGRCRAGVAEQQEHRSRGEQHPGARHAAASCC